MSIENTYPDHPEPASSMPPLPDAQPGALAQVQAVLAQTTASRYAANFAEATLQGTSTAALDAIGRQHNSTNRTMMELGSRFIRLLQAQAALDDVFFEAINRTEAQTREFVTRDPLERMLDCPPAVAWRERIKGYRLVEELDLPPVIRRLGVEATPRVCTALPDDPQASNLIGYLQSAGTFLGAKGGLLDNVQPAELGRYPVPLLAAVKRRAKLPVDHDPDNTDQDIFGQAAADALAKNYHYLTSRRLGRISRIDAVAVPPGVTGIGNIISTDLCVNLGWSADADAESPGAYWIALFKDGVQHNEQIVDPASASPLIGSSRPNPLLSVPPHDGKIREWRDHAPFTRETADMQLSIVGMPVHVLESRSDPHYDAGRAAVRYDYDGRSGLLQHDRGRVCFMANIAIVASY